MIEIQINLKPLQRALAAAPVQTAREISRAVQKWAINGSTLFAASKMNAPDDRNRADFLMRRPRASKGLRNATGLLRGALYGRSAAVSEINKIQGEVGFLNAKAARIARVHELGTVGKGGKMPDIVPKRAKFLAVPIRGGGASRSAKARIVKLKKVSIPARLGFKEWFAGKKAIKTLEADLLAGAKRALAKAVRA